MATVKRTLAGMGSGGRALWRSVTAQHDLGAAQEVTLTEACRVKDRLDRLDGLLRGEVSTWATLAHNPRIQDYELMFDAALAQADATATLLKQLLASLRLPEPNGRCPPRRGGGRGVYAGRTVRMVRA